MINVSLFIITILMLACAIKFLFNYKIETSIFIIVCTIAIVIALSAISEVLQIGVFIVYILTILSTIYCIIYVIINRKQIKKILLEVFTPSTMMLLLAYFAYYIVVRDKVLTHDDEAASWVLEIKHMYTNGFFKNYNSHNNIIGFFTFYNLKLIGYSEPYIFLSLWTFTWSCLALAINNIKWNKWYKALIYSIGSYCIINLITADPSYYMDTVLGVLTGVICVNWSYNNIQRKDYVWLFLGLIVLVNIKDELGAIIALMATLFCISCTIIRYYIKPKEERKFNYINFSLNIGLLVMVLGFIFSSSSFSNIFTKIIQALGIIYFILTIIALVLIITFTIIYRKKILKVIKINYKVLIIIGILSFFIIGYVSFSILYSKLPIDSWRKIEVLIFRLWSESFFGKPAYLLVIYSIIFVILSCILLIKQKHVTYFAIQSSLVILMIILYAIALMVGYTISTGNLFDHWLRSLTRYYAPIFIFASIWFLAKMLKYDFEYRFKYGVLVSSLILMIIFINQFPIIGNTGLANLESERYTYTYKMRPEIAKQAEFIRNNIDADEKLLIISSTENNTYDPFTALLWMRYELLPIYSDSIILLGGKKYMHTSSNRRLTSNELLDYIKEGKYNYIYMYSKNNYFQEEYKNIMDATDSNRSILYKVTPKGDHYLTLIDIN